MLGLELIIMEMNVFSQEGKLQKQKGLESSKARGCTEAVATNFRK